MSTRPVTVFDKKWGATGWERGDEIGNGQFHQWGSDYEEFETGPGNYTTAIIEMDDGEILTPFPGMIRFDDVEETS